MLTVFSEKDLTEMDSQYDEGSPTHVNEKQTTKLILKDVNFKSLSEAIKWMCQQMIKCTADERASIQHLFHRNKLLPEAQLECLNTDFGKLLSDIDNLSLISDGFSHIESLFIDFEELTSLAKIDEIKECLSNKLAVFPQTSFVLADKTDSQPDTLFSESQQALIRQSLEMLTQNPHQAAERAMACELDQARSKVGELTAKLTKETAEKDTIVENYETQIKELTNQLLLLLESKQ